MSNRVNLWEKLAHSLTSFFLPSQVHDILHFLPSADPDIVRFIFATEETGFRHLYLYTVQLATSSNKASVTEGMSYTYLSLFIILKC